VFVFSSDEAKPVVQDKISEVASGLISAYESGELTQALAEGRDGWQKWVKGFGKSLKRKVRCYSITSFFFLLLYFRLCHPLDR
jgi:glutamyl-tRNA synthetase